MTQRHESGQLWHRGETNGILTSTDEAVRAFVQFLQGPYPLHARKFKHLLNKNPDAARAEAVVFSWLQNQHLNPAPHESPSKGGPDYLCRPSAERSLLVEVTSLDKKAVDSGWPDELDEVLCSFSMITPNLQNKTKNKARQLAGSPMPRILTVCLAHKGASALLGTTAAEWMMTSETRIGFSVDSKGMPGPRCEKTNLKHAAFFRIENHKVVTVRQSVSAILLVAISEGQISVVGLLHPDPVVPFDHHILGQVPFLRADWPIHGNSIHTEWIIGDPRPATFYYSPVILTNSELKGNTA